MTLTTRSVSSIHRSIPLTSVAGTVPAEQRRSALFHSETLVPPGIRTQSAQALPQGLTQPSSGGGLHPLSAAARPRGQGMVSKSLTAMLSRFGLAKDPEASFCAIASFIASQAATRTLDEDKLMCQSAARSLTADRDTQGTGRGLGCPKNSIKVRTHEARQVLTAKQICSTLWDALASLPQAHQTDARVRFLGALAECQANGKHISTLRQIQRLLAYTKEFFPAQISVVLPPLNPQVHVTALNALVEAYTSAATPLSADVANTLRSEATRAWVNAAAHDEICFDEGYLTFDEMLDRQAILGRAFAAVMNGSYNLQWQPPTMPDEEERLYAEAREQTHGVNPRDMQACYWDVTKAKQQFRRDLREFTVRTGGMVAGAPFGVYGILLGGQTAVHIDRALTHREQNFRSAIIRGAGMAVGASTGGVFSMVVAGNLAGEFDKKVVSSPENRQAVTDRAFAALHSLRVATLGDPADDIAPLFHGTDIDEDAQALSDWEIVDIAAMRELDKTTTSR